MRPLACSHTSPAVLLTDAHTGPGNVPPPSGMGVFLKSSGPSRAALLNTIHQSESVVYPLLLPTVWATQQLYNCVWGEVHVLFWKQVYLETGLCVF